MAHYSSLNPCVYKKSRANLQEGDAIDLRQKYLKTISGLDDDMISIGTFYCPEGEKHFLNPGQKLLYNGGTLSRLGKDGLEDASLPECSEVIVGYLPKLLAMANSSSTPKVLRPKEISDKLEKMMGVDLDPGTIVFYMTGKKSGLYFPRVPVMGEDEFKLFYIDERVPRTHLPKTLLGGLSVNR